MPRWPAKWSAHRRLSNWILTRLCETFGCFNSHLRSHIFPITLCSAAQNKQNISQPQVRGKFERIREMLCILSVAKCGSWGWETTLNNPRSGHKISLGSGVTWQTHRPLKIYGQQNANISFIKPKTLLKYATRGGTRFFLTLLH